MAIYDVRITYDQTIEGVQADNIDDAIMKVMEWASEDSKFYKELDYIATEIKKEQTQC